MDSKFLLAEVQACCSSLGYQDNGVYHRGEDHLNAIKDLIRYLRRDGEICQIRRVLGEARVLQNDLVPMLKNYKDDATLFDLIVRLLVNLTQPAELCFNNKPPEDKELRVFYLQITTHLQSYKQFFAHESSFFNVITKKLVDSFSRGWEDREEEDRLLVERLLVLIRNVVSIPSDPEAEKRTENDVSVHDLLYWAMQSSGLESVFLYISSTSTEAQFCLHTLEIINQVLREQSPAQLASAGQLRTEKELEEESQELEAIRLREAAVKRANAMKYSGRHSRFGGTFTIANLKGIADADAIVHKSLSKIQGNLCFDEEKKRRRRPKNKLPVADRDATRKSTQAIRVLHRDFCSKFLDHCYNPMMRTVRDAIRHKKGEENDESFYLWTMRFFMEFNRLYNFDVGLVSETLSMQTFHLIQVHLTDCYERMITEKRQVQESLAWGRRLHLALKAYQELLLTVHTMGKSKDPVLVNNSTILKNNLFYVMEYRDLFVMLLKKFDDSRLSKSFLRDLFETAHAFVKMLEEHCKGNTHTMVQKTQVVGRKKKPTPKSVHSTLTEEELELKWSSMQSEIGEVLSGTRPMADDIIPFDAASSVSVEDQKTQAMNRIQAALRDRQVGEAVALFRAARGVWPEGDAFGCVGLTPEEELQSLKQIMLADLSDFEDQTCDQQEDDEDEEEEIAQMVPVEIEFKFEEYLTKFARGEVVKNCCLVLKDYATNSASVNHAVVKLLHRLSVDMKLAGLLYHVSALKIFKTILHDPGARSKHLRELSTFSKFLVQKFFQDLERNPLLVVETLFWKDLKEAVDVTEGYGSYRERSKTKKTLWTEEQENEIRLLWEEHRNKLEEGADVADLVLESLSNPGEKTRTQLVRQMVRMGLLGSAKDLKTRAKPRKAKTPKHVWPETLSEELKMLYEKHRENEENDESGLDVIDKIMRDLTDASRSRKEILMQLAAMDLIQDPNAYRKKGVRHIAYWRPEQIDELRELWARYENAMNPLDRIKEALVAKRSKNMLASKLLELGLIADKKALMNKGKEEKKRKKTDPWENATDEEDVVTPPTTDDETVQTTTVERKKVSMTSRQRDSAREKRRYAVSDLPMIVRDLKERGFEEPVKWVCGMMQLRADDLQQNNEDEEDDTDQGFALVPLSEENEEAMDDAGFLRLLRALGFSAPVVGQEAFWRIPCSFGHERLYATVDRIEKALTLDGVRGVVEPSSGSESSSMENDDDGSAIKVPQKSHSDEDDDDFDNFLKSAKKNREDGNDSDSVMQSESITAKSNRWKMLREMANTRRVEDKKGAKDNHRKRKLNRDTLDLDEIANEQSSATTSEALENEGDMSVSQKSVDLNANAASPIIDEPQKPIKRLLASDDDEKNSSVVQSPENFREDEFRRKKRRIALSDDDEEEERKENNKSTAKRRAVIESDSD